MNQAMNQATNQGRGPGRTDTVLVVDDEPDSLRMITAMLEAAEPDLTGFASLPREHWQKVWSNNPIERLNREIKRRADVVQIFPDRGSVTRLIGAILLEQHEEWHYGERRYLSETSMRRLIDTLHEHTDTPVNPLPLTA